LAGRAVSIVDEKRNTACNALGEAAWGFGWGLGTPLTVLPLLVQRLGGSQVEIGLIAAIAAGGTLVPQIFSSLFLQRGVGRKWFLIIYHWAVMLPPWLGIAAVVFFLGSANAPAARGLLLLLFSVFMITVGFILPAWQDWVADLFRPGIRGRAYAWSNLATALGGSCAALVAGEIAAAIAFPANYAVLFVAGTCMFALSMAFFIPIREPVSAGHSPALSHGDVFRRFALSLMDRNFRSYLVSRLLITAGSGPIAFFAIRYKSASGGGLSTEMVIALGAALTAGQAVAGFAMGHLGDRVGHKAGAVLGAAAQVAALAVALLVPGAWSCAAAFALVGAGFASAWVSHQNFLFETCPHDCRMAHITVSNLVLAPFTVVVPVATGHLIAVYGIMPALGLCLIPSVIGLLWLLVMVRDPRTVNVGRTLGSPLMPNP